MEDNLKDFKEFMKVREEAARAYVCGDAGPLAQISARGDYPATFFSPAGGYLQGADIVLSKYEGDAASFEAGSETNFQILQISASDTIAYWVGFQRAMAKIKGREEAVPFNLRVTEIFQREGGTWKLVHRHADTLGPA